MLNVDDAGNMLQECDAAVYHRDKHIKDNKKELLEIFHGSHYRTDSRPGRESPENYPFSFVANVQPRLVFDNPKVNCTSTNVSVPKKTVQHLGRAINQWIKYADFVKVLDACATDGLLMWSTVLTTFEVDPLDSALPNSQMKRMIPKVSIIENHRYFRDPSSTPATPPRFEGHIWVRDLSDVEKMEDVDQEALGALVADMDIQLLKRPNALQGSSSTTGPSRKEILAYEFWVPECNDYRTDPKMQNGTIYTLAIGQSVAADGGRTRVGKARYLRDPRPFFGPPWGPYSMLGFYDVPENTYPLSPVAVCFQQMEELNAHASAVANAASRMKNLVFVDAAHDTLQAAVMNSADGTVIGIPGLTQEQVVDVTIGGPAKEQYEYVQVLRERLDRNIGIDDAQRGELNPQVTATATNVAYQSMSVRMDYLKKRFTEFTKRILNSVGWYAWNSNNFVMFLAPEDADELQMKKPAFLGGPQQGEEHVPYDQAALDLEPYSMIKVDEGVLAQEVQETIALIAQLAQEMATAPWLGWQTILEQLATIRKFDWVPECINSDLFIAYQQQQQQQNQQLHAAQMAEMQLKLDGMDADNKLKKIKAMQEMIALHQQMQPQTEDPDSISKSANYKDLPEDIRRAWEVEMVGFASTQPLTAADHVKNALTLSQTNTQHAQKQDLQTRDQKHQQAQGRQSQLATMLRDSAKQKAGASGMHSASQRAQQGPTRTASNAPRPKK